MSCDTVCNKGYSRWSREQSQNSKLITLSIQNLAKLKAVSLRNVINFKKINKKMQNTYPNSFSLSYKWRKYQTMFNLAVIHSAFKHTFLKRKKCKQRNRQLVYFLAFPNGLCINLFYYFFYIINFLGKGLKGSTPKHLKVIISRTEQTRTFMLFISSMWYFNN